MKLFARIAASLGATADKSISRLENHDAIVDAAIRETRKASAQAKVRHNRVLQDGQSLQKRLAQAHELQQQWTSRAESCASDDPEKAMACLQRRDECLASIKQIEQSLQQHALHEQKLTASIKTIENRLLQITQQRNQMRSRESTAKAMQVISRVDDINGYGIDDAFDRWSESISESELLVGEINGSDALAFEFNTSEEHARLAAEVEAIAAGKKEQV